MDMINMCGGDIRWMVMSERQFMSYVNKHQYHKTCKHDDEYKQQKTISTFFYLSILIITIIIIENPHTHLCLIVRPINAQPKNLLIFSAVAFLDLNISELKSMGASYSARQNRVKRAQNAKLYFPKE